ncbi:MAG: glycosyltransferase [Calditrichaceae bacterium]|nr:glycosyltransferase [Calditrichaceae bacterium]
MAKRCLIISYYFPPVGGGGVQRIVKLIKFLSQSGWDFTILTADNDIVSLPKDASFLKDIDNRTKVIRIPISRTNVQSNSRYTSFLPDKSGFLQRWLSAFFYIPDIRKGWLKSLHPVLMDEININHYDCVLVTAPPYSLAVYAAQLTDQLSIPVILDMRDPWTTNPYKIHPTPYHHYKDLKIELESISRIKFGVSAYESLIHFYRAKIRNFETALWTVIPNGFDENDFRSLPNGSLNNGKFNIAFSGTFYSHINPPLHIFKAINKLNEKNREKILFHHIGDSQINLPKLIAKYKLKNNVKLWGYLSHKKCLEKLNQMDALCFILDDRNRNSINTIGGKVYEYLRLKKPILALAPENGEAADLIASTQSGEVISPQNTDKICETLSRWILGKNNYKYLDVDRYNREKQARQFLQVMNRACSRDQH